MQGKQAALLSPPHMSLALVQCRSWLPHWRSDLPPSGNPSETHRFNLLAMADSHLPPSSQLTEFLGIKISGYLQSRWKYELEKSCFIDFWVLTQPIMSWIGCFMITYAACLRLSCHHTSHKFRGTSFELFLPHCQILNTSPFWRHRHTAQQFRPLCLPRDPRNHEPELWMWFRYFLSLTKVEIYLVSFSFQMKYVEVL